jgi:hypothetical protein
MRKVRGNTVKAKHLAAVALAALGWSDRALLGQGTQHDSTTRRVTGFVVARYVEDGTRSIYGAQRLGPVMVLGGLLRNTRTDVTTTVFGVGRMSRSHGSVGLSTFVAGAESSDGLSLRLYMLPSARLGVVAANATVTAYQPLGNSDAVAQAAVNPLTLAVRVAGAKVGLATIADVAEGREGRTSAGPYAAVRVPGGVASVEWMTWHHRARREVRWGFSGSY